MTRRYAGRPLTMEQGDRRRAVADRMLKRIVDLGGDVSWPVPGYVIDSDETDDHVTHDYAFCFEHADMVAHGDSILNGSAMFVVNVSQSEADHEEWCAFHGCSVALNTGSPTDNWIDSALGLTEENPYAVSVTPYELARSACSMLIDDKRWIVWMRQAKRVAIEMRRKRRGVGRAAAMLALALTACTAIATPMPRTEACQEQADAWCGVLDPGRPATASGCGIVYRHWCGAGGEVSPDAQDVCLQALGDMKPDPLTGYAVPRACQATWAVP